MFAFISSSWVNAFILKILSEEGNWQRWTCVKRLRLLTELHLPFRWSTYLLMMNPIITLIIKIKNDFLSALKISPDMINNIIWLQISKGLIDRKESKIYSRISLELSHIVCVCAAYHLLPQTQQVKEKVKPVFTNCIALISFLLMWMLIRFTHSSCFVDIQFSDLKGLFLI